MHFIEINTVAMLKVVVDELKSAYSWYNVGIQLWVPLTNLQFTKPGYQQIHKRRKELFLAGSDRLREEFNLMKVVQAVVDKGKTRIAQKYSKFWCVYLL